MSRMTLWAILPLAGAVLAPMARPKAPDSPAEVRDKVIAGIAENYARLRTVRATVETTHIDPSVTERTVTTVETPGRTVTSVQEPRTVRINALTMRGADFRRDPADPHDHTWVFHKGVWVQYAPDSKTVWYRSPDGMPGMFTFDPRVVGSFEIREPILDRLKADSPVETGAGSGPDKLPRVYLVTKVVPPARQAGRRFRYEFDPAKNYLPTSAAQVFDDGTLNVVIDITYREVIAGKAWFMEEAVSRIYPKPGARRSDAEGWSAKWTERVKGEVVVNKDVPDAAFDFSPPLGTRVFGR